MAEKSEKATPKKLRDARKKGQVAKSQDFPSALTYIVAIALTLSLAGFLYKELGGFMLQMFVVAPKTDVTQTYGFFIDEMLKVILWASLPMAIVVSVVGVIVTFLIVGPVFSVEVFKPNMKKFNPVDNLKQKFKMKTVFELFKSMFKIFGAGFIIYLAMQNSIGDLVATASLPPIAAAVVFEKILVKVIWWTGIFFALIAIIDLMYQRHTYAKELKMEKFEVKQEYKDTEGNPEIKSKRRQLAQEIAYDEGTNQIRRAKAVITNPTHIAVAIGYAPESYAAPWIIAMGTEKMAELIIKQAINYNIPIMRNVPLAHQLLEEGEVSCFVPEATYDAIGEVLLYVISLEAQGE